MAGLNDVGRFLTETHCQRASGNSLQAVSSVEDVQVSFHNLGTSENSHIQADYREKAGHTKTKHRICRSVSCWAREAVCNWSFASPTVFVSHPVGQLDHGCLWIWQLGTRPLVPSGCGRRLLGQGACLTLSLLVDYMEVSGHVEMVGSVFMHTLGCLPPVGPTPFAPRFPNMWKAVLNPNTTQSTASFL
jgi:hypothetical protein